MSEILVERRQEARRRILKTGRIMLGKTSVISCTVRNISLHGRRLALPTVVGVPDEFVLDVFGEPPRSAKVIWRHATEVGVLLS